jgi:L-alanine-DL-glutamate epimerase-like enolase superfamily enzyme
MLKNNNNNGKVILISVCDKTSNAWSTESLYHLNRCEIYCQQLEAGVQNRKTQKLNSITESIEIAHIEHVYGFLDLPSMRMVGSPIKLHAASLMRAP